MRAHRRNHKYRTRHCYATVMHGCAKQKLNIKSSKESKIVGVRYYLPYTIWAKYFLKEQGYHLKRNVFYQDNKSAIKMFKTEINSAVVSPDTDIYVIFLQRM